MRYAGLRSGDARALVERVVNGVGSGAQTPWLDVAPGRGAAGMDMERTHEN